MCEATHAYAAVVSFFVLVKRCAWFGVCLILGAVGCTLTKKNDDRGM